MSILIKNLHEDIYARTQIPELLEDLIKNGHEVEIKSFLSCNNLVQVLELITNDSWRNKLNDNNEYVVKNFGNILAAFYLPINKAPVKFNFDIGSYTITIAMKPGQIYYPIDNIYPLYLICVDHSKISIKMLEGDIKDLNIIHSYINDGALSQIRGLQHEFILPCGNVLRMMSGMCGKGMSNEWINKMYAQKYKEMKIPDEIDMLYKLRSIDFDANKYNNVEIMTYSNILAYVKMQRSNNTTIDISINVDGLSEFDIKYIKRHGTLVKLNVNNDRNDLNVDLKQGENIFKLLHQASVRAFVNIDVISNNEIIIFTLMKYDIMGQVRETYTTSNLMECRSMFIKFKDALTKLVINASNDCVVQFKFY